MDSRASVGVGVSEDNTCPNGGRHRVCSMGIARPHPVGPGGRGRALWWRGMLVGAAALMLGATAWSVPQPQPAGNAEVQPPARIKMVYGADESFEPFEWRDRDGNDTGFQVDLIREIAFAEGLDLEIRAGPWSEIKAGFDAGSIDVVCMYEFPVRREYADFSEPIAFEYSEIFIRIGDPEVRSLSDLAGKRVVLQAGALAEEELRREGIAADVVRVSTESEAIRALSRGMYDAAVVTRVGGRYAIQQFKLDNVVGSSPPLLDARVAFAVKRGRADVLARINSGLGKVKSSGRYNAIYDKWFGQIERPAIPRKRVITYAAWIILPLLAVIAGALIWNAALRSQVESKTRELQGELAERRRAEEALRRSEDRFRVVLRGAHIMVFTQDRDLRYSWVYNPLLDTPTADFLGKSDDELFPAEIAGPIVEAKRRVMETGVPEQVEVSLQTDGRPIVLELFIEALRDADGAVGGVTCAAIDITPMKQAEAQRAEYEAQIRQSQKLESLGLLAGGIAHDFNNLLAGVMGNVALALPSVQGQPEVRARLETVREITTRASELTHQLLAFTGRRKTEMGVISLSDAAEEMCRLLGATVPPNVELSCRADPAISPITADATQVRQVIMNLIRNGIDAVGESPGRVRVSTGSVRADRAYLAGCHLGADLPEGEYAYVDVEDTGVGITPGAMARIFDPFFTTKAPGKSSGRGLGLSVVSGTMRRHHGAVSVSSTPGVSTKFRAIFPATPSAAVVRPKPAPAPTVPRAADVNRTVLVVDDTRSVRELMVLGLERGGFRVQAAEDGPGALDLLRSNLSSISCVVLDLSMPGMDGLEVFEQARRLSRDLPVVLTSGIDDRDAMERIRNDSNATFMEKPFMPDELVETVNAMLSAAVA